jgi:hypothetical protein
MSHGARGIEEPGLELLGAENGQGVCELLMLPDTGTREAKRDLSVTNVLFYHS